MSGEEAMMVGGQFEVVRTDTESSKGNACRIKYDFSEDHNG